jgi:NAD(P)H-hydrate epimerase
LAVKPSLTISMHDTKEGMTPDNSGEMVILDIGIPKEAAEFVGPGEFVHYPFPKEGSHKGQNGRLLILGGGPYTGAPALSGLAALAVGVDLVWIACPEPSASVIASYTPNFIVKPLKGKSLSPDNLEEISETLDTIDAVLVGPGLGRDESTVAAVCKFVEELMLPMLIDADGLYALAVKGLPVLGVPAVFTPHRREFARLAEIIPETIDEKAVVEMARKTSSTVLLKGPVDMISDGEHVKKNRTGNPAMTVGGTGDVLAGLVAGLMAKGAEPFDAARMGAYLSGHAGDLAFEQLGHSLTATDVISRVPEALKGLLGTSKSPV